ncbi:MAG: hypothetical protein KAX37_07365 [Opitutaceae bacterium]|nr:hypothetical protein [Opitutaceae bacterium]
MAFVIASASLVAAETDAKRSPFLPPDTQAATPAASEHSSLEFRGVLVMEGRQQFNFFEPAKRLSTWVRLNEPGAAVVVKSYDARADTVAVEFSGQSLTLALQKPKISSAPVPAAVAPAPSAPVMPLPVVLNPTPADEAKRLDAIAAEVRRRRLLRQQAGTEQNAKQN